MKAKNVAKHEAMCSNTSGTAVGNTPGLSVIDLSSSVLLVIVPAALGKEHILGLRGAYRQASDYRNINRGAPEVSA